jgi:hypothetical protein
LTPSTTLAKFLMYVLVVEFAGAGAGGGGGGGGGLGFFAAAPGVRSIAALTATRRARPDRIDKLGVFMARSLLTRSPERREPKGESFRFS